jgi:hypothetical protein
MSHNTLRRRVLDGAGIRMTKLNELTCALLTLLQMSFPSLHHNINQRNYHDATWPKPENQAMITAFRYLFSHRGPEVCHPYTIQVSRSAERGWVGKS